MKHFVTKLGLHHERLSELHNSHADALDDGDPHAGFHRALSEEHGRAAQMCYKAAADLPDAEQMNPGDLRGPGKSMLGDFGSLERASAITPDPREMLAKRNLRAIPRDGQPSLSELFPGDALEEAAAELPPEIRKAVI